MFPTGFRALGLGKVIGTPTMGAVIGTNSYSLIDGSTVRTPGVGVFLADQGRTNMENTGVKPDILVENSPEDNLAGRDRQLEVGAQELLKQFPAQGGAALTGSANISRNAAEPGRFSRLVRANKMFSCKDRDCTVDHLMAP
jgi:tricorn protease